MLDEDIKIENPGKEDENWFAEVLNKAKKLAGVDSVNVNSGERYAQSDYVLQSLLASLNPANSDERNAIV